MKKRDISDAQVKNVYLSIGSNLGNRIHFLEKSKYLLETHDIKIIKTSSYYETDSWPDPSFPKFINAVLLIKTKLNQFELFKIIKSIEKKLGRKIAPKNHPRNCDIDILIGKVKESISPWLSIDSEITSSPWLINLIKEYEFCPSFNCGLCSSKTQKFINELFIWEKVLTHNF